MSFINTAWLDYLGLEMPTTVDELEDVLIAFRDNAADLKAEFNIEGDIIPMSCIMNDGDQDPCILINGFGEGYGDPDRAVTLRLPTIRKLSVLPIQRASRKVSPGCMNCMPRG